MARLPDLARELVDLKVDVIVGPPQASVAAKNVTQTIPIVMSNVGEPVGEGLVASLAHPEGNVTGLSTFAPELGGKRVELLREAFARTSRLAVLWTSTNRSNVMELGQIKVAAGESHTMLQPLEVNDPNDFNVAFAAIRRDRADGLLVLRNSITLTGKRTIVEFAARNRLPAMYSDRTFVSAGGLMSYGVDVPDLFRRAATYVDKILKGARPADLPVEQPTKFELVINLKTARQIGVTIPQSVLYRADKVIR